MRMTDLEIGEHYAWQGKRVKLVATGVILKHYQHKGVEIEISGKDDIKFFKAIPTRELLSAWDDFVITRAKWEQEETEKHASLRAANEAKDRIMGALKDLDLATGTRCTAYSDYIILMFDNSEAAHLLADALQEFNGHKDYRKAA